MLKLANVSVRVFGAVHLSVVTYIHFNMDVPSDISPLANRMGGAAKYLTFWGCILAAVYFCMALLNDLISGFKDDENKFLTKIRDFFYLSIVFPVASLVGIMFWTLYAIDRELILPKRLDPYFAPWLNHSLHTAVLVYVLLELWTSYHKPRALRTHLLTLTFFGFLYMAWYHIIYFKTGAWVYPVSAKLDWIGRGILAVGCLVFSLALCLCGYYANSAIWRNRVRATMKSKRK